MKFRKARILVFLDAGCFQPIDCRVFNFYLVTSAEEGSNVDYVDTLLFCLSVCLLARVMSGWSMTL